MRYEWKHKKEIDGSKNPTKLNQAMVPKSNRPRS